MGYFATPQGGGNPTLPPLEETTTRRVLSASDDKRVIDCTHESGCIIVLPTTLSPGFSCTVVQRGARAVIAGTSSSSLEVRPPVGFQPKTLAKNATLTVTVEDATRAVVSGQLAPVPAEIGEQPDGLDLVITYPNKPVITREVAVTTLAEFNAAGLVAGTRIIVGADITGGTANLDADDIEVQVQDGFTVDYLFIKKERSRIWLNGGSYGQVELSQPSVFVPSPEIREEWLVQDVTIEGLTITTPTAGFGLKLRGRRILVTDCHITTENYGIWSGDVNMGSETYRSHDIIVIRNTIVSTTGSEATIRLLDVLRSAVLDNYLENHVKHNYRVHRTSDVAWAGRNLLIDAGIMIADSTTDDAVGSVFFTDNQIFHQTVAGVFVTSTSHDTYEQLVITSNILYSDTLTAFPGDADPSITQEGNEVEAAATPPSAPDRSVHREGVVEEAGTTILLSGGDHEHTIYTSAATTVSVVVTRKTRPGTTVEIVQEGAGQAQVVAGEGITLRHPSTFAASTAAQWSSFVVTVRDADEVLVRGDLAEAA